MLINNHIFYIIKKNSLKLKIKNINFGTNSKSFFLKNKKTVIFVSITKIKYIKSLNLKIFQNKVLNISKIIFFLNNIVFYNKTLGKNIFFPNFNSFSNLIKKNIFLKKIKKKKKIFFLNFKNINLISKVLYIFKIKKKYNSLFSHNDLFKDNIILYGNILSSIIDYNNYSYCKSKIDFYTIFYELTFNYKIFKLILIENCKKYFFNKIKYIIKIFFFRFLKLFNFKKSKNVDTYIKKIFYEIL